MIHYNVWFNLKPSASEADGLQALRTFLSGLLQGNHIHTFHILKNSGAEGKTALPLYHVLITFQTDQQFSGAFDTLRAQGIAMPPHGTLISMVADFRVEIFSTMP